LEDADKLKALGVDEVIIYCVNDGAVMTAWSKDQAVAGSEYITMMGDTAGELTKALGMVMNHPGPNSKFGTVLFRSKRVAMYVVNGVVKILRVAEGPGPAGEEDPAGDDFPEVTLAPAMIEAIKELKTSFKGEL
jgi:peroxiredoxin